jgi:uncharacterized membrane protein (UPF0182 family)
MGRQAMVSPFDELDRGSLSAYLSAYLKLFNYALVLILKFGNDGCLLSN